MVNTDNATLKGDADVNNEVSLSDVISVKGNEMKKYLLDNDIDEETADDVVKYYLDGLKARIEAGIASKDGTDRTKNEKLFKTMALNAAQTQMLISQKSEPSENEVSDYITKNGIDLELYLDGLRKILVSTRGYSEEGSDEPVQLVKIPQSPNVIESTDDLVDLYAEYGKSIITDENGTISVSDVALVNTDNATLKGDADVNNEVGLSDIVAVSKYNVSNVAYPLKNDVALANADMNGDGVVNDLDTSALIEEQLGK